MNRSYYNINSSNILSAKRIPSLTPPKQQQSTEKMQTNQSYTQRTKQIKEKAIGIPSQNKKSDNFKFNLPFQNSIFHQQQNAILSSRKATVNLSQSSEKLRKTSPAEKSPLSTVSKVKQINTSYSQQIINQILLESNQIKDSERDSRQKNSMNSRDLTTNSSKHRTEDYQRLQKENMALMKKMEELESKNQALETINQKLLNLFQSCSCNQDKVQGVMDMMKQQSQQERTSSGHEIDELNCPTEKPKRNSYSHEYSDIKPRKDLFKNTSSYPSTNRQQNQVDDFFQTYRIEKVENSYFRERFSKQTNQNYIPSVIKTIAVSIEQDTKLF